MPESKTRPFRVFQFLEAFLNEGQRLRLAVRMKGLYRAVMGNASGFYALDLRSAQGRMAAIKVMGPGSVDSRSGDYWAGLRYVACCDRRIALSEGNIYDRQSSPTAELFHNPLGDGLERRRWAPSASGRGLDERMCASPCCAKFR